MNRMEEYRKMMEELDRSVPELEGILARAEKRVKRKRLWVRPLTGLAACFAAFVLLVNFFTPVAYACSQIPVLRELAAAVTFSRSLTDAVENEYVQPVSLKQTENGITVSVEYLIVDQKQVNVFFRVEPAENARMNVDLRVLMPDMTWADCSYYMTYHDEELQTLTIDFADGEVPDGLRLLLKVDNAVFDFLLEFDPKFTAAGKLFPVNQTVMLDGQLITVTNVEVYPTHIRVNIEDDPGNTAWLRGLNFYVETDWGMRFDVPASGIIAQGTAETPTMNSYRADSTWFYEAKHLKVVITGAEWLRKDSEKIYVNLKTGEANKLPEGVWLHGAVREGNDWILEFGSAYRQENHFHQLFTSKYYDDDGTRYEFNSWSSVMGMIDGKTDDSFFIERFTLVDYPYDAVWLCPCFSHIWTAENVIVITVQ